MQLIISFLSAEHKRPPSDEEQMKNTALPPYFLFIKFFATTPKLKILSLKLLLEKLCKSNLRCLKVYFIVTDYIAIQKSRLHKIILIQAQFLKRLLTISSANAAN